MDPAALAEKLLPPRPLHRLGDALVAPPLPGSTTAWIAACPLDAAAIDACVAWAWSTGASRVAYGGPPGNYLVSGCDGGDVERLDALARAGFVEHGRHVDLDVRTDVPAPVDSRVFRTPASLVEKVIAFTRAQFGEGWALEAERAASHEGLFHAIVGDGGIVGVAAHSGNLAHLGTFGPVGVVDAARGSGLGRALSSHVFADLHHRGFATATVPWVENATVAFYASFVPVLGRTERIALRRVRQ